MSLDVCSGALLLFCGVLLFIVLILLHLDLVELFGIRLGGPLHPVSTAAEVDGRRHGLEVEGRMKPREVAEDATGSEDEEIAALLHNALVEALCSLPKPCKELLKEARIPGLVGAPLRGEGRDLEIGRSSCRERVYVLV